MKETGNLHWAYYPGTDTNNPSGFKALPAGMRNTDGEFESRSISAYFWSSTEYGEDNAIQREVRVASPILLRWDVEKENGLSVRCLKDN
jgi:uncharacterized protein (TIGR02145 family)